MADEVVDEVRKAEAKRHSGGRALRGYFCDFLCFVSIACKGCLLSCRSVFFSCDSFYHSGFSESEEKT